MNTKQTDAELALSRLSDAEYYAVIATARAARCMEPEMFCVAIECDASEPDQTLALAVIATPRDTFKFRLDRDFLVANAKSCHRLLHHEAVRRCKDLNDALEARGGSRLFSVEPDSESY